MLRSVDNIGMVFEGGLFPIYQVLDVTNVGAAQRTIIRSITATAPERSADSFRLDVGLDMTGKFNKYFYHNTCNALKTSRFDQASLIHPETWEVQSKRNSKDIQFTKNSEHSLSQKQDQLIKEKLQDMLKEYNEKKAKRKQN